MSKTYDELFDAARSAYGSGAYDDATLEFLFPQLKESEDERIRKGLLDIFKQSQSGHWAGMEIKDIVAWLEKQKEKDRIIPERELTDFEIEVHEIIAQARCDKRLADEAVLKQFEQEAACALMLKAEKQKEQKPAEWSEEDTEMYINVASSLRGYACGLKNEDHRRHIQKGLDWLENRFISLRPQPKQEWSEEDFERLVGELVQDIVANEKDAANYGAEKKPTSFFLTKYSEKFKSLRNRPKTSDTWKPSEQVMVSHVHQLQHALRHFGIEKEITL